ncbi:MAG: NUDIX domain-containing protein [Actinobacteria bacterium]|nr:NUDIX domain-containing protein [Actinomycetota bacterium]
MPVVSAGLVLYRRKPDPDTGAPRVEVLLVHPGGPYWAKKDAGAWSIPKGEAEPHELGPEPATVTAAKTRNRAANVDLLAVALRETREETGLVPDGPFQPLGGVKAHGHKLIFAWAVEHDCDPAAITSTTFTMEWPPRSGRQAEFPEVDRAAWFTLEAAREAIVPVQRRFLDDLAIVAAAGA